MSKNQFFDALVAGLVAGFVLGFFLKGMQVMTGFQVYTLLMNIDYLPVLKNFQFPEWIEFSFHLIVSIAISFLVKLIAIRREWKKQRIVFASIFLNIIIALVIYPTTVLSTRTPELFSLVSITIWLVGHVIYGGILGVFLSYISIKSQKFTEKSH